MRRLITMVLLAACAILPQGCTKISHNLAGLGFGKVFELGSPEYGRILYVNGMFLMDISRENAEWEIATDDEAGISYDSEAKTLKGVKKIRRTIGHQATGYLKELAQEDTETAKEAMGYLKTDRVGGKE